jgi:hypothetical protein
MAFQKKGGFYNHKLETAVNVAIGIGYNNSHCI